MTDRFPTMIASRTNPDIVAGSRESFPRASVRVRPSNENHHLWNNNGTWYLHYTVHPTPLTKSRIRHSLGTKDLETARRRRDQILATQAGLAAAEVS